MMRRDVGSWLLDLKYCLSCTNVTLNFESDNSGANSMSLMKRIIVCRYV